MIDYGALIDEYERRAAQYDHMANVEREPIGSVSLTDVIRAEAKAEMCRQVAAHLRDESRRRRELSVYLTALDGTRTRRRFEHRADGRTCIHESEWTGTHYRACGSSELYDRVEVELGNAVSRYGGTRVREANE